MPLIKKSNKTSASPKNPNRPDTVRISIIDDQRDVTNDVARAIGSTPDLEIISIYHTAKDALNKVPADNPDIILMEILLSGMNVQEGLDCLFHLKNQMPDIGFLIFTVVDDKKSVKDAISFGANGYILKSDGTARIIKAIREYISGMAPMSHILCLSSPPIGSGDFGALTKRQFQIVKLINQGFSNTEIADRLGISQGVCRQHIHQISRILKR